MKNRIGKLVLCMLVLALLIPIATAYRPSGEILDQSTPLGYQEYICGVNNNYLAQSFKPTLSSLSKVDLGLFKQANVTGNFMISIRERLNGKDLVSKNVSLDDVPWMIYGGWVSIDLQDITVTPDKRYYIVITSDETRQVMWIDSSYNPYKRGRPWMFGGSLPCWIPFFLTISKRQDLCFRTYGFE